jgi:uncharacterized protein YjgD (DUF1641 family)
MAINIGDMLGGIGAAFGGTAQQYSQNIRQREQQMTQRKREELQARQQAMYQDAGAAFKLLQQGDLDGIISLANDRLELLQTFPDADPSDTMRILENAMAAKAGDPIAISNLAKELTSAASVGYASGILKRPEVDSVVVDGRLVNRSTGNVIFEPPVDTQQRGSFGLTPSYFEDQEGNIRLGQPSSAGGIQFIDLPEGMTPVLPASQRAFDPAAIAQQGAARTLAEVANIEATTDPTAARAGAVTTAQQEAEIATLVDRAVAERDAAKVAEQGARNRARQTKQDQLGLLSDLVGVAKQQSTGWTTGFVGSQLSKIPGTPAYDLGRTLDTLLASAGFETLQEMRNNSPTGGALGSVTERELALLQATWGSLQQSQSKEQFEANLDRFNRQLQQSWDRVNNAYKRDYGVPYFQDGQQLMSPQTDNDPLGIFQTGAQ